MARYSLHSGPHDNCKLYETFQSTCAARGLLEGDDEWDQCLEEAGLIQTGHQLRQLFASILLHNNPLNPRLLYERHLPCLSDDCRYRLQTHDSTFSILTTNKLRAWRFMKLTLSFNNLENHSQTIISPFQLSISI